VQCPTCGAIPAPSSRFCERDGTRLIEESPTDHIEQAPAPELGGVTDRGRRHRSNEDALSLAVDNLSVPTYVLVVCDGVSQARDAQRAARVAAEVTCASLLDAAHNGFDSSDVMRQAIQAAHEAVCALPEEPVPTPTFDPDKTQPPGCTLVAALVRNGQATIGWVGDSRAYRFGPDLTQLLTHDHSWFNAVVESGEMTTAQAAASPNANAILQAVGPLNYDDEAVREPPAADVVCCDLLRGHMLLLCSDGLWKYAPQARDLAELMRQSPRDAEPLELSRRLVEYANMRGGTDNVTAAIFREAP
jgi:serine/threonine protein phosphatase PrpC